MKLRSVLLSVAGVVCIPIVLAGCSSSSTPEERAAELGESLSNELASVAAESESANEYNVEVTDVSMDPTTKTLTGVIKNNSDTYYDHIDMTGTVELTEDSETTTENLMRFYHIEDEKLSMVLEPHSSKAFTLEYGTSNEYDIANPVIEVDKAYTRDDVETIFAETTEFNLQDSMTKTYTHDNGTLAFYLLEGTIENRSEYDWAYAKAYFKIKESESDDAKLYSLKFYNVNQGATATSSEKNINSDAEGAIYEFYYLEFMPAK